MQCPGGTVQRTGGTVQRTGGTVQRTGGAVHVLCVSSFNIHLCKLRDSLGGKEGYLSRLRRYTAKWVVVIIRWTIKS